MPYIRFGIGYAASATMVGGDHYGRMMKGC